MELGEEKIPEMLVIFQLENCHPIYLPMLKLWTGLRKSHFVPVLYRCETWFLNFREEQKLQICAN